MTRAQIAQILLGAGLAVMILRRRFSGRMPCLSVYGLLMGARLVSETADSPFTGGHGDN